MIKTKKSRLNKKNISVAILLFVIFGAVVLFILYKTNKFPFKTPVSNELNSAQQAQTTSDAPSAQSDFNNGDERQAKAQDQTNRGNSIIIDNQGDIPNDISRNNPKVSESGEITVFSPTDNSLLSNGQILSGTSTLPKINYRVIDDISGMITIGELAVVNGSFSGAITFDTLADTGQIDIYATQVNGVEFSNIAIPVRFK